MPLSLHFLLTFSYRTSKRKYFTVNCLICPIKTLCNCAVFEICLNIGMKKVSFRGSSPIISSLRIFRCFGSWSCRKERICLWNDCRMFFYLYSLLYTYTATLIFSLGLSLTISRAAWMIFLLYLRIEHHDRDSYNGSLCRLCTHFWKSRHWLMFFIISKNSWCYKVHDKKRDSVNNPFSGYLQYLFIRKWEDLFTIQSEH